MSKASLFLGIFWGLWMFMGCQSPSSEGRGKEVQSVKNAKSQLIIQTLNDMSSILEDKGHDVDQVLQRLRQYLQAHEGDFETINHSSFSSPDIQILKDIHPQLSQALVRFAKAQINFRERANDVQKIELSYLLRSLR